LPVRIERKIFRVGDSNVVTLLKGWLDANGLKAGDNIVQVYNSVLLIMPVGLDPECLKHDISALLTAMTR
jgi:hypothetical protein